MADTILGAASGDTGNAGNDQNNQQTRQTQTQTQTQEGNQGTQQTQTQTQTQTQEGNQGTQQTQTQTQTQTQAQGPPEKYEFKLPEGVQLDQALVNEVTPIFKELKLTQEQAQKLVDIQARAAQAWGEKQIQEHQALVASWAEEAKKDQEIGGQAFEQNVAIAIKALNQFGTPALKELLDATGLGNNPELIRFFFKVGQTIREPKVVEGGPPTDTRTAAQILFPSMKG